MSPQRMQATSSYRNDVSGPLRALAVIDNPSRRQDREAAENPKIPNAHVDSPDRVVDRGSLLRAFAPGIPAAILDFDGIAFPGVGCNCAPPDTNGAVGLTQYVQMVNAGYQVFDKATGDSVLGPSSISSLWSGFGGACETGGAGDPVVLYDQLADRWVISQFASVSGGAPITDECVAVSTTGDATGTYNRYAFHLGSEFFDYPHLSIWPDAYYMSMNVFNAAPPISMALPCRRTARRTPSSVSRAGINTRLITSTSILPRRRIPPSRSSTRPRPPALPSYARPSAPASRKRISRKRTNSMASAIGLCFASLTATLSITSR
ncbi:MAG: hypothetical protein ABI540_08565 [Spartobacteria bacterium]